MRIASLLVAASLLTPAAAVAQTTQAPLQVVKALFDGMRARDSAAIRATLHPEARLLTAANDSTGAPVVESTPIDGFLGAVSRAKYVPDERISDPIVQVDDGLATVWARYAFYAGDRFSHCGIDTFDLVLTSDGWRIVQIVDTRKREGCEAYGGPAGGR